MKTFNNKGEFQDAFFVGQNFIRKKMNHMSQKNTIMINDYMNKILPFQKIQHDCQYLKLLTWPYLIQDIPKQSVEKRGSNNSYIFII